MANLQLDIDCDRETERIFSLLSSNDAKLQKMEGERVFGVHHTGSSPETFHIFIGNILRMCCSLYLTVQSFLDAPELARS